MNDDELSSHELVARYTSRLEALFEERGGQGAGLMPKAERFNYAVSERVWDDLCWLNSEGRGVAEHDRVRFESIAQSVIAAVEALPRPRRSHAPEVRARTAPPVSRHPKKAPATPASGAGTSCLLTIFLLVALGWAAVNWHQALLAGLQQLVERYGLQKRPEPAPLPTASSSPGPATETPSAEPPKKLRKRPKYPPPLPSALGGSSRASSAPAQTTPPRPSASPELAPPATPSESAAPPPTAKPKRDSGSIGITPKELESF